MMERGNTEDRKEDREGKGEETRMIQEKFRIGETEDFKRSEEEKARQGRRKGEAGKTKGRNKKH